MLLKLSSSAPTSCLVQMELKIQYIVQLSEGNVMSLGFTEVSSDNAQNLDSRIVKGIDNYIL